MKTDDLIKTLSEDATRPPPLWRSAGLFALAGSAIALVLFFVAIGPRPNLDQAAATSAFQIKMAILACITVITAADYVRLMRPGAWPVPVGVIGAAGIFMLSAAIALILVPTENWSAQLFGGNWRACLASIPFLAAAPLAAAMAAMRNAAPTSPASAGLASGGAATAIGAMIYATHCPADSPIFYAVWYSLAALVVLAAGAIAGRVALRW